MTLDELNGLDVSTAERELLRCCGSRRWAARMVAARPFANEEVLLANADAIWTGLDAADWLEAFAAHPRIGDRGPRGAGGEHASWSHQEQARVAAAPETVKDRLAARNRDYEARFGYIFIVCATGKSADEMLGILERRLGNDPGGELSLAAEEQRKIMRLRLAKLLGRTT